MQHHCMMSRGAGSTATQGNRTDRMFVSDGRSYTIRRLHLDGSTENMAGSGASSTFIAGTGAAAILAIPIDILMNSNGSLSLLQAFMVICFWLHLGKLRVSFI